jgi:hypothetical protein
MYDYSVVDLDDYMAQPFQIVSMPADTMSETFAELSEMF